jgi:N-acetylglucosamine kinase-like BadF-type ATPase
MSRYFLGVDVGSTKCHAAIATAQGQIVGFGHGSAGNHETVGVDGFRAALHHVVQMALTAAGLEPSQIEAMGLGIAGYDWDSDRPMMHMVIDSLGFGVPYQFVNDSMIGLIAGATEGWGVSVVAGTSCNCCGRDRQGKEGRITGNGGLFGEYGGGGELVESALAAISRAWSLRGPATLLTNIFVEHFQAGTAVALLEGIARGRYSYNATLAPLVFQAVNAGDGVAISLIDWISRELGGLALGVARQLDFIDKTFEVVLAGSFYKGTPRIAETMTQTIHEVAPGAVLVRVSAPPVVGAVMLAMEQAALDFRPLRSQLLASANQYLSEM